MENVIDLHRNPVTHRRARRIDFKRQYARIRNAEPAAVIAAGLVVPRGLDRALHADGYRILYHFYIGRAASKHPQSAQNIWSAAAAELLLDDFVLQFAIIFLRVHLADRPVAFHPGYDRILPAHCKAGRIPFDSVPAVGDLRRMLKPWNRFTQLIRTQVLRQNTGDSTHIAPVLPHRACLQAASQRA